MYRKPIRLVNVYLIFTLIAYVFTYMESNPHNMVLTVLICGVYFAFMTLGYYSIGLSVSNINEEQKRFGYSKTIRNILVFASAATIIVSFVNVFTFYSSTEMVLDYLANPGAAYEYVKFVRRNNISDSGMITISSSLLGISLNTLSFTKYIVFIFIPLFWKEISKSIRVLGIASILIYILQSFLIGAMINVAIIVFSLLPILIFMGGRIRNNVRATSGPVIFLFSLLLIAAIFFVIFFMGTRYVSADSGIGEILFAGISGLGVYISHGYVGLSTCFDISYVPTFGASTFRGLASTFLPKEVYDSLWVSSYLMRNQSNTGWPALQKWSTIFPWLASDISFFLIPLVMLFMGRFMARVWKNAIADKNPYAFLLMSQLMIFAFMIPANNQLFHSYGNAVGTIIIYFMYRLSVSKKRFHFKFNL